MKYEAYRDERHAKRIEKGKQFYKKMKFETEEERKAYHKAVESNPNNVLGLPVFYPPVKIWSGGIHPMRVCPCGGNAIYREGYICFKCGKYVEE